MPRARRKDRDGKEYSFAEFQEFYKHRYSDSQIAWYWRHCELVPQVAEEGGSSSTWTQNASGSWANCVSASATSAAAQGQADCSNSEALVLQVRQVTSSTLRQRLLETLGSSENLQKLMREKAEAELKAANAQHAEEKRALEGTIGSLQAELRSLRQAAHPGPMWLYEVSQNQWGSFSPESSNTLMSALERGDKDLRIKVGATEYYLDLEKFLQTNTQTCTQRRIRCNLGIPSHWDQKEEDFMKRMRGTKAGWRSLFSSFQSVAKQISDPKVIARFSALLNSTNFHKFTLPSGQPACPGIPATGWRFKVCRAYHVENLPLYLDYLDCQSKMLTKLQGSAVPPVQPDTTQDLSNELLRVNGSTPSPLNERLLFHGTKVENATEIAIHGFDLRLSKEGGFYGKGLYFARQSCKAAQYCKSQYLHSQERAIILSRVCLGDYTVADAVDQSRVLPPEKPRHFPADIARRADSIIARSGPMLGHPQGMQTHDEYIIFDSKQAYPEYILYFVEAT